MLLPKETRMQMAIPACQKKQIKSRTAAAEVFGVSRETFRDWLQGVKPRAVTRANGHELTSIEEESVVKCLLDADKRGFSIRPQFLRGMAHILLTERTQDPTAIISISWASKFVKRHPALRTGYNRRITYQRAKQENPKVIKQ